MAAIELLLRGAHDASMKVEDLASGTSVPGGSSLQEQASAQLVQVLGLGQKAWNVRALLLLAGTGVELLDPRLLSDSASRLTVPIVSFLQQKAAEWLENAGSDHAECDRLADLDLQSLERYVRMLLELVVSMSLSDTPRFLRVIKEVTETQLESVLAASGDTDWLLKPQKEKRSADPTLKSMKRLAKQNFGETERRRLIQLIIKEDTMKAAVLVQSLRSLQKLKGTRKKKSLRAERSTTRGAYALTEMVSALHANFLQAGCAYQAKVGQLERNPTLRLYGLTEESAPLPLSMLEEGLGLMSPRTEASGPEVPASRKTLTALEEGLKAMELVFVAFAASRRGELQKKNSRGLEQYIAEFEILLPMLSALATGRLELFLLECRTLASYLMERSTTSDDVSTSKGKGWLQAIDLVIDVFTFIGMDTTVFLKMTSDAEEDMDRIDRFLLPTLFQALFDNSLAGMDMNEANRKELRGIIDLLGKLLLGLCVGAPPDFTNNLIMQLVKPLEHHAQKLVKGDARMEKASSELISSTRKIAAMAAEGKSLQQMQLFMPGEEGEAPPALSVLEATLDLLLPFLPSQAQEPLIALMKALMEMSLLSANPTLDGFAKHSPVIVAEIALALGIPEHNITGIMALVQGKWDEAADMCRPFCDLNPEALDQMVRLLPAVRQTVSSGKDLFERLSDNLDLEDMVRSNSHAQGRQRIVEKKVNEGGGSNRDLFAMVDLDGNGTISREEFQTCALRLGLTLSEHRVIEIFSRCKKQHRNTKNFEATELNADEFELAMQYLQGKIAHDCLKLLGIAWSALMFYLAYLTLILVLIFLFIFLGISVFVTTGAFGTVINSIMTIAAGLGLSKSGTKERTSDIGEQAKTREVLDEVKDTVFDSQ